ncbi:hypothetical protein HPB51_014751 [Rhipicephalus microplus]|uniref:Uncharacterized protein n=1 Tax=Rhipicephalus microplus TaxID=6941 RepID=A0A9J6DNB0_RHIMP|nr:hypothetical protein HPB51_014751 [Rhipicephalus microplus]
MVNEVDDTSLSISPSSLRKQNQHSGDRSVSSSCSEAEGEGGPEKPKKRTLLGKIRKRLSFKKNRSKSMEARPDADAHSHSSSRSVSTDRAKSVPLGSVRNNGSTRSSISEGSGISAASSRTYVSDKSLLVVEAKENGVIRPHLEQFYRHGPLCRSLLKHILAEQLFNLRKPTLLWSTEAFA